MPALIPVSVPLASMVPTAVLLLLHVPLVVVLLSVVLLPLHTVAVPVIAAGNAFTVTATLASGPQHPAVDRLLK